MSFSSSFRVAIAVPTAADGAYTAIALVLATTVPATAIAGYTAARNWMRATYTLGQSCISQWSRSLSPPITSFAELQG